MNLALNTTSIQIQKWLQNGAIFSSEPGHCILGEGPFHCRPFKKSSSAFYVSDFFDLLETVLEPSVVGQVHREALRQELVNIKGLPASVSWEPPDKDLFFLDFFHIQSEIQKGILKKVVPVVFESALLQVTKEILAGWLYKVLASVTKGFVFGHWNLDKGEGVLGLTPELLFSLKGQALTTMALAGTAQGPNHPLIEDPKEWQEHHLVVHSLKDSLSSFGTLKTSAPYEWSPGALTHLRTDISLSLNKENVSPLELVQQLHPTPALGGVPKRNSEKWLKSRDIHTQRGSFGAPFGFITENSAEFVVAIRCLIWKNNRVYVGSGCGVVEGSQLDKEWQELSNKRQAVKQVFGWN